MSESTKTAAEAIAPVLEEAVALGLSFRTITGLTVKRAKRLGVDMDEIGLASESTLSDEIYQEHVMLASWLLCAEEAEISDAIERADAPAVCERWQAENVTTLAHEKVIYRAFMARWLEYRVEMVRLFGDERPAAK